MGKRIRRIAVVSLVEEQGNRWNGFVEKIHTLVHVGAAHAPVDLYCCCPPVFEVAENVRICLQSRARTWTWGAYVKTALWLIARRYDVVVIPTLFHPALPLLFAAGKLGGSTVIYRMGDTIKDTVARMPTVTLARTRLRVVARLMPLLAGLAEWVVLRLSDHILTQSPSLVAQVARKAGPRARVHLAYNYVPSHVDCPDELDPPFARMLASGATVFMYFGHAQPEIRGLEYAISLLGRARADVGLVLLGPRQGGDYFERFVEAAGLGGRVILLPAKPKPLALAYLRRAHYCIIPPHPSYVLPAKILDAAAIGVPLMLPSTMTDAAELFGAQSLMYAPDDGDSFVRALEKGCLERDSRREAAEEAARFLDLPTFADVARRVFREIRDGDSGIGESTGSDRTSVAGRGERTPGV